MQLVYRSMYHHTRIPECTVTLDTNNTARDFPRPMTVTQFDYKFHIFMKPKFHNHGYKNHH